MAGLRKKYITKPERIYTDPLHPTSSDYDVVIPQTTSDAVMMEGTNLTLTDYISETGGPRIDVRNTTVAGSNVVSVSGTTVTVGNYAITVANGYTENGVPQDKTYVSDTTTTVTTPGSTDNYLLMLLDGTFAYCQYFDGGRDFPTTDLHTNQVYFHEQLRRSYKYNGSTWDAYPCTAIARFNNGQLAEIFPYNTWWWDEVLWEETEPDLPAGMQVSIYEDTNGDHYLKVNKGAVIDNGHLFKLDTAIYKKVQLSFSAGTENGSGDGNYTNTMTNIVPEDIASDNLQGFSVTEGPSETTVFNSLNPNLDSTYPRWQVYEYPTQFVIGFPEAHSINKYTVTAYADSSCETRIANAWDLLGSTDGTNWELIDSITNAGFGGTVGEVKSFATRNTKKYNAIKFIVKGNLGDSYTSLGQIRFFESVPELGVYVITDGDTTDVLTSPYSGPTLPAGYIYYHRIGTISIDENNHLFGAFPGTSIAIDAATNYKNVNDKVVLKADSSLKNINSDGAKYAGLLSYPRRSSSTNLVNNTVYRAAKSGYVYVYASGTAVVYNHSIQSLVSNSDTTAAAGGAPAGIPCNTPIAAGSYYKVVATNPSVMVFTPCMGEDL